MNQSRNYNLYNIFFYLYETRNMSKTAELLNLSSHANISKGVKQLEHELGVKLFATDTRGVTPTVEADRLYETIKPLFEDIGTFEKSIKFLSATKKVEKPKTLVGQESSISIHLVTTGGHIDGELSPIKGQIVPLKESIVPYYLKNYVNPNLKILESQVTLKDSRLLNEEDLSKILGTILQSKHDNILITHGLDTIVNTAMHIEKFFNNSGTKKIILVGSFYPIKGSALTDATYNLGFAVASFQSVKPGVYIVVQGKVFNPDEYHIEI